LEIEVGNLANPDVTEKIECLLDSGVRYSVIPSEILKNLGIEPYADFQFRLGDGSILWRKRGGALFKYKDRIGGGDVLFGEEGDCAFLGTLTLASLGFVLDPLKRELKPLPMILAGYRPNQSETS
jgi:hypothetical protein